MASLVDELVKNHHHISCLVNSYVGVGCVGPGELENLCSNRTDGRFVA